MGRKRHTAEEIVAKLRQVDVLIAQGRPVADAVRAGVASNLTLSLAGSITIPCGFRFSV
jgi:putative transposase